MGVDVQLCMSKNVRIVLTVKEERKQSKISFP